MDLFYTCALYLAILFVSLSLTIYLIGKHKAKAHGTTGLLDLPPGQTGYWPIIRETLDFFMAGRNGTPGKFVTDRTSRYSSDVFRTSLLGVGKNVAVFCGASGNKFLFSGESKYVTWWWPRSVRMVAEFPDPDSVDGYPTDDSFAKTRRFILEFVRPEALQRYLPIMDSMAKQHLEADWAPYEEVRVFPLLMKYTFALSSRLLMGNQDPTFITRLGHMFELVASGMLSVPINFPGTARYKAIQAGKSIRFVLLPIIKRRKKEIMENKDTAVAKDLLSKMLLAEDENGQPVMTESEIGNTIIAKFLASQATSSTTITFVVKYLAEYPDVYEQVWKEQMEIARSKGPDELLNWEDIQKMRYSWMVACEVMRLSPPVPGAFRRVITDFSYSGFTIPKGWKTHWNVYSTHLDHRYFPDPEKFDPSRFQGRGPAPFTFVPFGGGPHMCPGKEYARVQILVFMHNLVIKFRWKKAIPDEKIIYKPLPVPASDLPIRIEPCI
ncbi:beta-amyrin 28-monooxygenase-like [Punica granatum]|uniref:Beta-amyrin 28-monooxygenase-like n=1 Tax=Punica granatum TaxID=22663 RepID=A0A218WAA7_PUNGR|nr:beta-amyrin 28-monooxygenase-like [Punica granatum]OWM69463.1 hypothetical protein CDL15_Pgr013924 [Punica granatum]